jgi:hypothetical protein
MVVDEQKTFKVQCRIRYRSPPDYNKIFLDEKYLRQIFPE